MTTSEARSAIGQLVMSYDPGHKLIRRVRTPHGPYRLKAVTKGGLAILGGRDEERIPTSLLHRLPDEAIAPSASAEPAAATAAKADA